MRVASATRSRFRPSAVNGRLTRSGARRVPGILLRKARRASLGAGTPLPALLRHQPLDAFAAHADAIMAQLAVDPVSAVGAPGGIPDGAGSPASGPTRDTGAQRADVARQGYFFGAATDDFLPTAISP
jgi:hypothetical protein